MTDPQNPNPWQHVTPPMPPMPPDDTQWQKPADAQWQSPYPQDTLDTPNAAFGHYQVAAVNNLGFPTPSLPPVLPQEMAPARPSTITAAMWIWIAAAVLSVALGPVLMLTNMDYLIAQDSTASTADGRRAAELGLQVVTVVVGFAMLVAAAPYIAFAVVLRNGHNWARILLTILGMFGLVAMVAITLVGLQAPSWQVGVTIGIVVVGLTIAAVVLQFLPASNKYVR